MFFYMLYMRPRPTLGGVISVVCTLSHQLSHLSSIRTLRLSRPAPARHIGLVIIILSMLPDLRTACALQMQWA
jgi:hypothetical protein